MTLTLSSLLEMIRSPLPHTSAMLSASPQPSRYKADVRTVRVPHWSVHPIRDKLRRECSCQAGLSGWLKEK